MKQRPDAAADHWSSDDQKMLPRCSVLNHRGRKLKHLTIKNKVTLFYFTQRNIKILISLRDQAAKKRAATSFVCFSNVFMSQHLLGIDLASQFMNFHPVSPWKHDEYVTLADLSEFKEVCSSLLNIICAVDKRPMLCHSETPELNRLWVSSS